MPISNLSQSLRGIAAAVGLATLSTGVAQAACYTPQVQLPAQTISTFAGNPGQMLQQYASGGPQMISQIRDLAASDPATLPLILGLVANANSEQKKAIGAGLAQAARICVRTDEAYANDIQQAIAKTKDQELVLAYTSVTGDQPTGAVGAAVSGGALGGQTNALPGGPTATGPAQGIGIPGVPTPQFSITSSVTGTSGFGASTTRIGAAVSQ
jgi:hypothetical protein